MMEVVVIYKVIIMWDKIMVKMMMEMMMTTIKVMAMMAILIVITMALAQICVYKIYYIFLFCTNIHKLKHSLAFDQNYIIVKEAQFDTGKNSQYGVHDDPFGVDL